MSSHHRTDTVFNANDLVSSVLERWRKGEQPDTARVLDSHPELRQERSLVVDLAYTEYSLRKKAGERLTPRDFGDRFPSFRQAILRSIEVQEFMEGHPELAAGLAGPIWPEPGDAVAGFQIVELLGRGALARVYLARESAVGNRLVVVKVAQDGESEAQLLGKLKHENVMEIYSAACEEATGLTVICTPLVGTATLVELLDQAFADNRPPQSSGVIADVARQRQPAGTSIADLPPVRLPYAGYVEAIADVGLQLARALDAAHRAGITHRDIKPSNVLVSWQGRPLLLDFNLSTDPYQPLRRLGGTHAYMPPERLRAILSQRAELDLRTDPRGDIYSWGVLVYQLLTGKLPFTPTEIPTDDDALLQAWLECRLRGAPAANELNPHVDGELAAIVGRCMSSDAVGRYPTAHDLAAALTLYLSPRRRAVRFARQHRRQFVAAAAAWSLATAAGGIYLAARPDAATRHYRAGLEFYNEGNFRQAMEAFNACLELQPRHAHAMFARGQSHRRLGDFAAARQDFLATLELAPQEEVYRCLADCDLGLGEARLAATRFEKAIGVGLQGPEIYNNQAHCYVRSSPKRAELILAAADKALRQDPNLISARYLRAIGALRLMDTPLYRTTNQPVPPHALADVEFLLNCGQSNAELHELAGKIFAAARQSDAAAEQIRKLFELGKTREQLRQLFPPQLVLQALSGVAPPPGPLVGRQPRWEPYIAPPNAATLPPAPRLADTKSLAVHNH